MKHFYSLLLLLLSPLLCRSQALHVDSTRFITGYECCVFINSAIPTADSGILFVGWDDDNPGGIIPYFPTDTGENGNVLIGKIDRNRHISWIKVYGGSDADIGVTACQTPDGGYAVLGNTLSSNGDVTGYKGAGDMWLLRLDALGNLLWEKCYGSSLTDGTISIANTPDGGFILLGSTNGSDGDVPFHYGSFWTDDWLIVKTDSTGNVQWSKDLGTTGDESTYGSVLSAAGGYYLISATDSSNHDCTDTAWHVGVYTQEDIYVLKLDTAGHVLWDSSYGGSHGEGAMNAIYDSRDSSIAICGWTFSSDYMVTGAMGGGDFWVLKLALDGTMKWEKTLGSTNDDGGTGICMARNGGYAVYGATRPGTIGDQDCWLFILDNNGDPIVSKIFGGTDIETPQAIVPLSNGYAATGFSLSDSFTQCSNYGRFSSGDDAFITYIDYWPLSVANTTNSQAFSITAYPNPSQDEVTISLPGDKQGSIIIINSIGQEVYDQKVISQADLQVKTSGWPRGMYCVIWRSVDGNILTTKLIKE